MQAAPGGPDLILIVGGGVVLGLVAIVVAWLKWRQRPPSAPS